VKKKMQEKMKMLLQKDENLAHIQQQYCVSFYKKKLIPNLDFSSRYGIIRVKFS